MRFLALWLILLTAPGLAHADDAAFKVGVATRDFIPAGPFDWRGAAAHALHVMIWYPAVADAREQPQSIGPRLIPLVRTGSAAPDAAPAPGPRRPLVLLSHGFGGTASDLAWLAVALAAHGFIAVAVNHPGNNRSEDLTVEGYALMWLRAVDLSAVIDAMRADETFGERIDPARIGAAGHSLGGYTVLAIAGGITDPERTQVFCRSPAADALCTAQEGVSDLRRKSRERRGTDPDFRQRYGLAGQSYRDARVRAVFAMAPGPGPALTPDSLGDLSIPVAMVKGSADEITPPASGAEALAKAIPGARLKLFPGAGHFVFFDTCTAVGRLVIPAVCRDPDGTDRDAIHAETIGLALDFFTAELR